MARLDMYTHLDYDKTGHVYTFRLSRLDMYTHLDYDKTVGMYTHLDYDKTGHIYTFRLCQDWTCIHI